MRALVWISLVLAMVGVSCSGGDAAFENCGNGVRDTGEACEGADLGTRSCLDLGFTGGLLRCGATCEHDTAACELCENYPCGPLGAGPDKVLVDRSFVPANAAAVDLAGADGWFYLSDIFRRGVTRGGPLRAVLVFAVEDS